MNHAEGRIRHVIGDLVVANALLEQHVMELQARLAAAEDLRASADPAPPSRGTEAPRS